VLTLIVIIACAGSFPEINFGIAIGVTRTYFWVYCADHLGWWYYQIMVNTASGSTTNEEKRTSQINYKAGKKAHVQNAQGERKHGNPV
jgi:hypothetical protein